MSETFELSETEAKHQELTRNLYLERRNHLEKTFAGAPNRDIVETPDGAKIKVLSSIDIIPENLRSKNKFGKLRVSIYVPTLWYSDVPRPSDYRENRLATSILSGDIDIAIQLKAEGMNDMAFLNKDGSGAVESKVASSAVDVLKEKLEKFGLTGQEIEFSVLGYSEGSTQGASIAAEIVKKDLGTVKEYVSIGGGGLIGAENQKDANPVEFIKDAIASVKKEVPEPEGQTMPSPLGKTVLITEGPDIYYVPVEIIGENINLKDKVINKVRSVFGKSQKIPGGLENAIGKTPEPLVAGYIPEVVFADRLLATKFDLNEKNPVPWEREKAAATINHDYDFLAENGVPMIVFTETKDTFFNNIKVRESVGKLKTKHPNSKIVQISSNAGHEDPWKNPSGLAFILQVIREKSGIK